MALLEVLHMACKMVDHYLVPFQADAVVDVALDGVVAVVVVVGAAASEEEG